MLTPGEVKAIDKLHLYEDYEEWPIHCRNALKVQVHSPQVSDVDRVICTGMGGSGIVGDILVDWLQPRISIPIYIVKDYHLPGFVDEKTFVIAVSCSGDTDETINTLDEALKAGASIATISSGGRLEAVSLRRGFAHTRVKALHTPRSSLPYLFYPVANILRDVGLLKGLKGELNRSVEAVEDLKSLISLYTPINKNPAKRLAKGIYNGLPVIYASQLLRGAALRFKNSLNENTKIHALVDILPELCHNDIEAWAEGGKEAYRPIFLRHRGEPPEVEERFKVIRSIIEAAGFKAQNAQTSAEDPLGIIISTIYLLDYASIYAATLKNVNPLPTPNINILKKQLSRLTKEL